MTDNAGDLLATQPGPGDGPAPPDVVVGADATIMAGQTIEYRYSSGREYRLDFTAEQVTFTMLDAPAARPELGIPITLPYLARSIRDGQVLVHWMVPGRSGHISLVIDYATHQIYVSALMPLKMEFFDVGDISLVTRRSDAERR